MGRSRRFPEASPSILTSVAAGASLADAAAHAGVKEATAKSWVAKGRKDPDSPYGIWAAQIERARDGRDIPKVGTEAELKAVVWKAAYNGSVSAMKLYWEIILDDRSPDEEAQEAADPLAAVDELAARRAA